MNYYNEHDPKAAAWLRELIVRGNIPSGTVDERSIVDVTPGDLDRFAQCHFFAGIGGWSLALRLAGWPDDQPVWTGSCPCQPFSAAGKRKGTADERHLWPVFHGLIAKCRPAIALGEQVASKDGRLWLDGVRADLEAVGYDVGAADLCAAGVGAPHIRQRIWWGAVRVADRVQPGLEGHARDGDDRDQPGRDGADAVGSTAEGGDSVRLADATLRGLGEQRDAMEPGRGGHPDSGGDPDVRLADADSQDRGRRGIQGPGESLGASSGASCERSEGLRKDCRPRPPHSFWRDADWLHCRDDRWRPVEPGTFPLAHGIPARVVRLRGYGNAIVPQVAVEFIHAFTESIA